MNHLYFIVVIVTCTMSYGQQDYQVIEFEHQYKFNAAIEEQVTQDTTPWKYQMAATEYSLKSDYVKALLQRSLEGTRPIRSGNGIVPIGGNAKILDAKEYIIDAAEDKQIVIINEAHHVSRHRIFTRSLLKSLYELGYRQLGLEALGNGEYADIQLNSRGYATQASGYYTRDPQFADMIREALDIGYEVFAYEYTSQGSGDPRERAQAENIKAQIDRHPNNKFIIHCGYDHALEGDHGSWGKAMAGRLAEYTGIDPLTIDQVHNSETLVPDQVESEILKVTAPRILTDSDGNAIGYKRGNAHTDIAVVHGATKLVNGRPHWMTSDGKQQYIIDISTIDIDFPVMVLAYVKGEPIEQSVPMDILELSDRSTDLTLVLRQGDYQIVVTNEAGDSRKFSYSAY